MRTKLLAAAALALLAAACQRHDTPAASTAVVDTTIGAGAPVQPNVTTAATPNENRTGDVVADTSTPAPEAQAPSSAPSPQQLIPRDVAPVRSASPPPVASAEEWLPPVTPASPSVERQPEPVRQMTEQQAVDLALATGSAQDFGSGADGGSVRVKDVHSPQDPRQCRAYAIVEGGAPSSWSVACHDSDGRWRLTR